MPNSLNSAVRGMRERLDLTQEQLAKRLFCSPQAVSDYELGRRAVPKAYLMVLALQFSYAFPDPEPPKVLDMACEACEIHRARVEITTRRQIRRAA